MKDNETKTQIKPDEGKKKSGVLKTILNTIINVLIVIVLIISILIAVMALSSKANNGMSVIFGHSVENIQTDSMKGGSKEFDGGGFEKGDVIIGKYVYTSGGYDYKAGDIVTFKGEYDEETDSRKYICHRIIEVAEYDGKECYRTQGDQNPVSDQQIGDYASYLTSSDIVTVFYSDFYQGKILKGVGNVLSFLQSKFGFFICILVPMIIFFLYELIRVIFNFAYYKKAKEEESQESKQSEINEAVAKALAEKEAQTSQENLTPEQMEQFKKFLEQQKLSTDDPGENSQ